MQIYRQHERSKAIYRAYNQLLSSLRSAGKYRPYSSKSNPKGASTSTYQIAAVYATMLVSKLSDYALTRPYGSFSCYMLWTGNTTSIAVEYIIFASRRRADEGSELMRSKLSNNIREHALHKLLRISKEYLPDLVRRCAEPEAKMTLPFAKELSGELGVRGVVKSAI